MRPLPEGFAIGCLFVIAVLCACGPLIYGLFRFVDYMLHRGAL